MPRQECWENTNRDPLSTEWVGVTKDSDGRKPVRSRLVARDFKEMSDRREGLFAATPPLETLKAMLTFHTMTG